MRDLAANWLVTKLVTSFITQNHAIYVYISTFSLLCTALYNLPITRQILGVPKSIQASVTLLENLHIIVEKTPAEDLQAEIFPMLFSSYESTTLQVQVGIIQIIEDVDALFRYSGSTQHTLTLGMH